MTFFKTALALAVAAFSSHAALAHDFTVGTLIVAHPHSFATPPGARTGAGYMAITNRGAEDDRLIAVETALAPTMLHRTRMENGVMKMRHQTGGVPIPAGQTVTFEPGGLHVMFMGLTAPLVPGTQNAATLVFEKAGPLAVVFDVESRRAKPMDHGTMQPQTGAEN